MTAKKYSLGIVGRKAGMTRVFTEDGKSIPVTLIEATPNRITQIKTPETDGYSAVQVAVGTRSASLITKPVAGHLAKANPQWRELQNGGEALVIFAGADAYISPAFYPAKAEHGKVVPTWNYIAVHAWGQAEVFDEPERLLQLVSRLSDRHEQGRAQPWAVSDAPREYIDAMLRAIVGFALPIRRLEGKWKLSQNRSANDQTGVRVGLATSNNPRDHELAARMNPTE